MDLERTTLEYLQIALMTITMLIFLKKYVFLITELLNFNPRNLFFLNNLMYNCVKYLTRTKICVICTNTEESTILKV